MQIELGRVSADSLRQIGEALIAAADAQNPEAGGSTSFNDDGPFVHKHRSMSPEQKYSLTALADVARAIHQHRRGRNEEFGFELSGEPAWDMLLDLFIQRVNGSRISITSLCIASSAPATTALRYIDFLEAKGAIVKFADPHDKRRSNVELAPATFLKIARHLSMVLDSFRIPKEAELKIFKWS